MSPQDCWAAVSKLNKKKNPNTGHLILVLLLLAASGRRTGGKHAHARTSTASYLHKVPLCKTFWGPLSSFKGHGWPCRQTRTQQPGVTATHDTSQMVYLAVLKVITQASGTWGRPDWGMTLSISKISFTVNQIRSNDKKIRPLPKSCCLGKSGNERGKRQIDQKKGVITRLTRLIHGRLTLETSVTHRLQCDLWWWWGSRHALG